VLGAGVVAVGVGTAGVVLAVVVLAGAALPAEPPPHPTFNNRTAINKKARLSFILTSKYSC
jgi:hypothetical protein